MGSRGGICTLGSGYTLMKILMRWTGMSKWFSERDQRVLIIIDFPFAMLFEHRDLQNRPPMLKKSILTETPQLGFDFEPK